MSERDMIFELFLEDLEDELQVTRGEQVTLFDLLVSYERLKKNPYKGPVMDKIIFQLGLLLEELFEQLVWDFDIDYFSEKMSQIYSADQLVVLHEKDD